MRFGTLSFGFEKTLRKKFIDFPFHLYKADPQWIPPLRSTADFQLSPANPFFRYGRSRNFLHRKGREILGRITAILNPRARSGDEQVGYFAYFECITDAGVAGALLGAASAWLRKEGVRIIRGPIQYSTYSSNRFVIEKGPEFPYFLEPYNPLVYPEFVENYGFEAVRKYDSYLVERLDPETQLSERARQECARQGFRIRPFRKEEKARDLRNLYELSEICFADNFSFTSVPWEEFYALHSGLTSFVDLDFLLFVIAPDGSPAGFVFGTPDYAPCLRAMKGKTHVLSKVRFVRERRRVNRAILKTLAVHPDHQGRNLGSLLSASLLETAQRKGYAGMIYSTTVADNPTISTMATRNARIFRRYAIYEKRIC